MDKNKIKSLYKTKALESYKTKLDFYVFKKVLYDKKDFSSEDLMNEIINDEIIEIYTTQYLKFYNHEKIEDKEVKDIYKLIKEYRELNKIEIEKSELNYISKFDNVFSFPEFERMVNEEKKCFYCEISETEIEELINRKKIRTKRERGFILEIDRKNPNKEYTRENSVMCCYWCNNAKTDEFTEEEFKGIGLAIKKVWENRKTNKYKIF